MNAIHFLCQARRMRFAVTVLMFCLCIFGVKAQDAPGTPYQKRAFTYNIHHGEGLDGKLDLGRIAKVINSASPDVVALQEVDSAAQRTGGVYQLGVLGEKTLMHATYGKAINFQGGGYGVGILSKEEPLSVRRIPLPGVEPRLLLVCEFKDYVFACMHLDLDSTQREASLPLIEKEAASWHKPFVMAGDWNSTPKSGVISRLKQNFTLLTNTDWTTFPANHPTECIDYLASYTPSGVVSLDFRVLPEMAASDHRPVWADLRFRIAAKDLMSTEPYLQDPKPTQMTVMFQTNAVAHCWVEVGTDSLHTKRVRTLLDGQEVCYDIENKIVLDSLRPGTRYYYRVCVVDMLMKHSYEYHMGDTLRTRFYSFRTPSDEDKDFTCLVFNDLHEHYGTYKYLLEQTRNIPYDFVVFNGDCLPEPASRDHALRMIHNLADAVDGAERPIIFMRGNHEIRNYYSAGMHRLLGYPNDKTYNAWSWGDTRFMVLDCGEDKADSHWAYAGFNDFTALRHEQIGFIKNELKSKAFKKAKRHILLCHIPIFANEDKYHPCTELWGPLLAKQPFDIALFAHLHHFRYVPYGLGGAQYPVYGGGGPEKEKATVAVLQKRGDKLHFKVISQDPAQCIEKDL